MAAIRKPMRRSPFDADMLVDLSRSGLDEEDATLLRLKFHEGSPEGITPSAPGYAIPYFDRSGEPTGFYRYRFLVDTRTGFQKLSGEKPRRYTQPPGSLPHVYLPPYIDWDEYLTGADPLLLTEGEKKSARVTKAGIPTIGLGGVWSFQNAPRNEPLIEELDEVNWEGRQVFIVYDSDAGDKLQIQQAEHRLATQLLRKGANPHIVRLPGGSGEDKIGLDDYVQQYGAESLQELCRSTEAFEDSEALFKMNTEVAYVKDPGLIYVIVSGQLVSPTDFHAHRFSDRRYTRAVPTLQGTRLEERSTAADWLKWPSRNAVERLEFEPGQGSITDSGALNLWRGWKYAPRKGDIGYWRRLLDHLFANEPENRRWVEQWCAFPFQFPGTKQRSAVAMWGRRTGTGKSVLGYTLGDLYGDAFAEVGDKQIESSDFNSWARNKQFVMGDDITGSSNRQVANTLKTMITRERIEINIKHVPQYFTRDCINYYFTSNSPDAFLLDENDRRFFIHEMVGLPLSDEFYAGYDSWRRSERGRSALMHYLMHEVDCTGFNPTSRPPMTDAKAEMIGLTRTDLESWLIGVRDDPDSFCQRFGGSDLVTVTELKSLYDPQDAHRVTFVTYARKLKEVGIPRIDPADKPPSTQIRVAPNGDLIRLYALRNAAKWERASHDTLKAYYEKTRGLTMRSNAARKY